MSFPVDAGPHQRQTGRRRGATHEDGRRDDSGTGGREHHHGEPPHHHPEHHHGTHHDELEDFPALTQRYERELLAHCYRMSGSFHEAEDLVQETFLRAWKASADFQGRSSVRTWLYRIATNVCLTNLEGRPRRPLPTGLGTSDSLASDAARVGPGDPLARAGARTPSVVVAERDSIRLAFIAALQHLPARQRAVLILRDVLRWSAAEVAEALETTTAAVNSALQRAHAQMADRHLTEDSVETDLDPGPAGAARPVRRRVLAQGHRHHRQHAHRRGGLGDAAVQGLVHRQRQHRRADRHAAARAASTTCR